MEVPYATSSEHRIIMTTAEEQVASAAAANVVPANANEECVGPSSEKAGQASSCEGCPNQAACASGAGRQVDPAIDEVSTHLSNIKHKILVLSGKGGVGKSMVAGQLSWYTSQTLGAQTAILDVDICGPSQPRMMGVEHHEIHKSAMGWSPVYASDTLAVMSIGFMLSSNTDAVIWRGPRKNGLIKQFLTEVDWGEMDYLFVDAPPGTSDEHISIAQYTSTSGVDGAVIVTTPQELSLLDVRKEITFCRRVNIPILGVIENMSGFVCPCCQTKSDIFPAVTGGARRMCEEMNVPFLGALPMEPALLQACENGQSYIANNPNSLCAQTMTQVFDRLLTCTPALKDTFDLIRSGRNDDTKDINAPTNAVFRDDNTNSTTFAVKPLDESKEAATTV